MRLDAAGGQQETPGRGRGENKEQEKLAIENGLLCLFSVSYGDFYLCGLAIEKAHV
jgi:hypothetical protein